MTDSISDKDLDKSLFIVPTPIGNLKDITIRALDIFETVELILAEDTRTTATLLKHYNISTSLKSFHIHNEHQKTGQYIEMLEAGKKLALVSDAGTPGIADPGYLLIREALKANIGIEVLPGSTAFVPALLKSGFPSDKFIFEGFLPHKKGKKTKIKSLLNRSETTIFYESPHRIIKTLEMMIEILGGERSISVSKELTKVHEETVTGTLDNVKLHFEKSVIKGEFVIVIEGNG